MAVQVRTVALAIAACLLADRAGAADVFGGIFQHGSNTPFTKSIGEHGSDIQVGYRFAPITRLAPVGAPSPYLLGSVNTRGQTSFVAGGLSWRIGGSVYLRPGLGLAVHTGPSYRVGPDGLRTDLGSRVLFEPEIAAGFPLLPRLSLEASWTHLSHAQIFGRQNPGLDMIGARLNLHLP